RKRTRGMPAFRRRTNGRPGPSHSPSPCTSAAPGWVRWSTLKRLSSSRTRLSPPARPCAWLSPNTTMLGRGAASWAKAAATLSQNTTTSSPSGHRNGRSPQSRTFPHTMPNPRDGSPRNASNSEHLPAHAKSKLLPRRGDNPSKPQKTHSLPAAAPIDRTESVEAAGKAKDARVREPCFVCAARRRLKRMLFPTTHFLLFFLVVAGVVAALDHRFTAKKAVLVVASYYFY